MAGRIVLFGATGYTGRLVAGALLERGARPLLAARNEQALRSLASELGGGLETAVADVARPQSIAELVSGDDVLISCVGPFLRYGGPALDAAIGAGATYLDSTGEPAFIRSVFEEHGPRAERTGAGLLTAFGYDWVPGNLAGALALREAGEAASRVVLGYYFVGGSGGGMSGGTMASSVGFVLEPGFAWRDGRIVTERAAARVRGFDVNGKSRPAFSVGASEHFALPHSFPSLRDVDVYLGWFGPASRPMQVLSAGASVATRVPGMRSALDSLAGRLMPGSSGGPDEQQRSQSGSHVSAIAWDDGGRQLAEVHVAGVNGYTFTGAILAWGAATALERGVAASGAIGPVEAYGLDELERGCAEAGIERVQ